MTRSRRIAAAGADSRNTLQTPSITGGTPGANLTAVRLHFVNPRDPAHCATSTARTKEEAQTQLERSRLSQGLELYSTRAVDSDASLLIGTEMGTMVWIPLRNPEDTFSA